MIALCISLYIVGWLLFMMAFALVFEGQRRLDRSLNQLAWGKMITFAFIWPLTTVGIAILTLGGALYTVRKGRSGGMR